MTFSILTAAYNNAQYLNDWCSSIMSQSYRPLEVVFVNDASTDRTKQMIEGIRARFVEAGIYFYPITNKKRLYCAAAYAEALRESTGYYMGVVDADDMLSDPEAIQRVVDAYRKHSAVGWIYTQFNICHPANMRVMKKGFCRAPTEGQSLLDMGLRGKHYYSHFRTFSRRINNLDSILQNGLRAAVDKYMGYRLEELGNGMFLDRVCYHYRNGSFKGITHTEKTREIWKQVIDEAVERRKDGRIIYPIISAQ